MRIIKSYHNEKIALAVYNEWVDWHRTVRPQNIMLEGNTISYDFVHGSTPTYEAVFAAARAYLWGTNTIANFLPINRTAYIKYVSDIADDQDIVHPDLRRKVYRALKFIETEPLTPVKNCHGDLTLENCVKKKGGLVVFLDPGFSRGLPCRELDEAKLLQSVEGWDAENRGPIEPMPCVERTRIHLVLLMTHYIRALRHYPTENRRWLAQTRIKEICQLWDV